jgi:hypothetical protein
MNDISMGRSPSAATRIVRGIAAAALSTVLIAGLAGCMTGKLAGSGPVDERNAVDVSVPARVEQQLARQAATNRANSERFAGRSADRVAEEVARTSPHAGMTADHYDRLVAQAQ